MYTRFVKIFSKQYSAKEKQLFAQLRRSALFANLGFEDLCAIAGLVHVRVYSQNELVFLRNEPAQALYIVIKGEVQVHIDRFGKEEKLFTIGVGESLGHEAILPQSKRLYSAIISSENALLYAIDHSRLQEILKNNPKIEVKVMYNLAALYKEYIRSLFVYYGKDTGFLELGQIKASF